MRYRPKSGRRSVVPSLPSSGAQSCDRFELVRKIRRPPRRSRRAASGTHLYGSAQRHAPYSLIARSNEESGSGTDSPGASTRSSSMPVSRIIRRAVSSCAGVGSTPTTRAPRFASLADRYAVPHPSSTTSRPATLPRTPTVDSGMPKTPNVMSSRDHARAAAASVYSAFAFVQLATLPASDSGELIAEPERDLARRRLGRIGAVHEVVGHRHREVAADRPRLGVGRVRRADRLAERRDGTRALDDERPGRAGADELDELAEERLLLVLGVMALAERAVGGEELAGADGQPARLDAAEDLGGEPATHGVGLDEDEAALHGHRERRLVDAAVSASLLCRLQPALAAASTQPAVRISVAASGATGVSQYGHTCQTASSGALQLTQACFSFVVQIGHTRKDASTGARQTGQLRSCASRSSIALISSLRSRTSSRYSGGRKSMYTKGPTNGSAIPSRVAMPTSHGSLTRRRASLNTQ